MLIQRLRRWRNNKTTSCIFLHVMQKQKEEGSSCSLEKSPLLPFDFARQIFSQNSSKCSNCFFVKISVTAFLHYMTRSFPQSHKTVTTHLTSNQLLSSGFTLQRSPPSIIHGSADWVYMLILHRLGLHRHSGQARILTSAFY